MGVVGCSGIAKPSSSAFRLIHPFSTTRSVPKANRPIQIRSRAAAAAAAATTASVSTPNPPTQKTPLRSLYARPSLKDMQNERAANRARVYDFLRGLGIVPDELDGLELPVTVDVMKDRVEFLHSLGLTVADVNEYPLVLGCSVKKNMIPVLDYLGKLGLRKSTFTGFLRKYPQVLHASVKVDLEPVVKYLQGMDVKPVAIPRLLEKYPEVLGFKLDGTMSTSVAYLVAIGVDRRQIGALLTQFPEVLGMRVGRVIKPFVEYLEGLGMRRIAIARMIEKKPYVLGFDLADQVKINVRILLECGVRKEALPSVIREYPDIIGIELEPKILAQKSLLQSMLMLGDGDFGGVVEKMPQVVTLARTVIVRHVDFLKRCGFSTDQVKTMVVGCPQVLALNLDIMGRSFQYFREEMMDRDLEDLVAFPAFFTYGLESTVKPRHLVVTEKGLKCSLGWLLNCTDEKFEERMSYDSIGIEEMEPELLSDVESKEEPSEKKYDSSFESDEDSDDEYYMN